MHFPIGLTVKRKKNVFCSALTKDKSWPTFHTRRETLEENLMEEQYSLAIQKYAIYVLVIARWLFRTSGHFEWP